MLRCEFAVVMHNKSHASLMMKKEDNAPTYLFYNKIKFVKISSLAVLQCSFLVTWLNPSVKNVEATSKNKTKNQL
jgi:hypothetical protein